jgi:hypothetical protein
MRPSGRTSSRYGRFGMGGWSRPSRGAGPLGPWPTLSISSIPRPSRASWPTLRRAPPSSSPRSMKKPAPPFLATGGDERLPEHEHEQPPPQHHLRRHLRLVPGRGDHHRRRLRLLGGRPRLADRGAEAGGIGTAYVFPRVALQNVSTVKFGDECGGEP